MTHRRRSAALTARHIVLGCFASTIATTALADPVPYPSIATNFLDYFRAATDFYLDLDVGAALYPAIIAPTVEGIAVRSVDSHTGDVAWGAAFGWRFTPYFAAEAGFADLGRTSAAITGNPITIGAQGKLGLSIGGPTVGFVGTVPFDTWEGYLKVGYLFSQADLTISGSAPIPDVSTSSYAPFVALGVRYEFDDRWYAKL
jgi:hypothetical protein